MSFLKKWDANPTDCEAVKIPFHQPVIKFASVMLYCIWIND